MNDDEYVNVRIHKSALPLIEYAMQTIRTPEGRRMRGIGAPFVRAKQQIRIAMGWHPGEREVRSRTPVWLRAGYPCWKIEYELEEV